jgi:uncharacterized protein YbjQ (UPF0145 family)
MPDEITRDVEVRATTVVQGQVIQPVLERIKCICMAATGRLVYEFTVDGKRVVRVDADAYDAALDRARENAVEEGDA